MNDDYYLESSAFTKRYKREQGSDFVDRLFNSNGRLFYLSTTFVEVVKVFYRLYLYPQLYDTQITEAEFNSLRARFAADLSQAQRIVTTDEVIQKSETILQTGFLKSAFDILQLTGFLVTKEIHPNLKLVSADNDICDLAFMFTQDVLNLNNI